MNSGKSTESTELASGWDSRSSLVTELEKAKEELELVSYVTSHDLQVPLRSIMYACNELEESKLLAQNPEAKANLEKINREANRLKTLMQGVLDYMRLETFGPAHSLIDMNEIITTALTILDERIIVTGAKINHGELPQIYGHRGRLTRLFVNLLDNALKFHGPDPYVINISVMRNGGMFEFTIEDNGIGIDEEYHDIIFVLFQRLHPAGEYPGHGIGLALSRKIVESHGGKLWVESKPGGSRFKFTLPVLKNK